MVRQQVDSIQVMLAHVEVALMKGLKKWTCMTNRSLSQPYGSERKNDSKGKPLRNGGAVSTGDRRPHLQVRVDAAPWSLPTFPVIPGPPRAMGRNLRLCLRLVRLLAAIPEQGWPLAVVRST